MSLPSGFTPVKNAESAGDGSCFLGVIIETKQPIYVGGQFELEFVIQDDFSTGTVGGRLGLTCKTKRRTLEDLPKRDHRTADVACPGDCALVRHMKMGTHGRVPFARTAGELRSEIIFFPAKSIPAPEFSTPFSVGGQSDLPWNGTRYCEAPSKTEQMAIISVKAAASPFMSKIQKAAPPATFPKTSMSGNKKDALIKDIIIGKFYNLVGEIVKMYYADQSNLDLYISDYTENKDLYHYTDPDEADEFTTSEQRSWKGPYGQVTIAIRLWEPHASFARSNFREGDLIRLLNVRTKFSRLNLLEGALHQDQKYPEKIGVVKCTLSHQIEEHAQRKTVYLDGYEAKKASDILARSAPKIPSEKPSTKKKEVKKERKEKQRLEKEIERVALEKAAEEQKIARAGINPHIRAGDPDIQLSTLAEIIHNPKRKTTYKGIPLDLPFINCNYRTRVRVVDHWPLSLKDFTCSLADPEYAPKLARHNDPELFKSRFEWRFALLIEDAVPLSDTEPDRLILTIGNSQAQNLLKMDAVDLHSNPAPLQQLTEKLFILWGNLHERKHELLREGVKLPLSTKDPRFQLQSKPFDCCIQEFGEQTGEEMGDANSWTQRFTSMNTTVMD